MKENYVTMIEKNDVLIRTDVIVGEYNDFYIYHNVEKIYNPSMETSYDQNNNNKIHHFNYFKGNEQEFQSSDDFKQIYDAADITKN